MIANTLVRSYEENLRIVSLEFPDTWILINKEARKSLSLNDEKRIMTRWENDKSWTHLAHEGVLYARQ